MVPLSLSLLCLCVAPVPKPEERAKVTLEFDAQREREFRITVEITTLSGATYLFPVYVDTNSSELACSRTFANLVHANWLVAEQGKLGIEVYGVRAKNGKTDPVKSLIVTAPKDHGRDLVTVSQVGKAKGEYREGDGKPAADSPASGPDLGPEPYVEFDFSSVPVRPVPVELVRTVETSLDKFSAQDDFGAPNGTTTELMCVLFANNMESIGFKTDVVEKSKVRVYGGLFDGQFYPATRGTVTSPNLKANELPIITNPKKKD